MQRKWRLAAAAAALLALLGAAVIAGLAAALPDTLYTDGSAAELRIASLPYLSARKKQGAVPADSTAPDTSSNVTLALFGVVPVKTVRAVTTARRTVLPFGMGKLLFMCFFLSIRQISREGVWHLPFRPHALFLKVHEWGGEMIIPESGGKHNGAFGPFPAVSAFFGRRRRVAFSACRGESPRLPARVPRRRACIPRPFVL